MTTYVGITSMHLVNTMEHSWECRSAAWQEMKRTVLDSARSKENAIETKTDRKMAYSTELTMTRTDRCFVG